MVLGLWIVSKGGILGNEYGLCTALSSYFCISDCIPIVNCISQSEYVYTNMNNGVRHFQVSDSGKKYLNSIIPGLIPSLLKKYGIENSFLNNLIGSIE